MRSAALGLLVVASLTPVALRAQHAPTADSARVYPIAPLQVTVTRDVVRLERVPASVTVVGADELRRARPAVTLDEGLALVPGLVVNNRQNFSLGTRLSIRGFGARAAFGVRGIRILMDGIPLTMPDGQASLNNLDLGSARRIEVIRGPASSLYGNAAGGVLSVETAPPPDVPLAGEARVTLGGFGEGTGLDNLRKYEARAGGRSGGVSYFAGGAHYDIEGFRRHSRTEATLLNANAAVELGPTSRLRLVVNAVDQPEAQNPGSLPLDSARLNPRMAWPNNVATGSGEADRQLQGGVAYSRTFGDDRLDASVYALGRSVKNPLPFAYIDIGRSAAGFRGSYGAHGALAGLPAALVAGVDVEAQRDARRELDNVRGRPGDERSKDQIDRVASVGPFAEARLRLAAPLELTLGGRFDAVRFQTDDRLLQDGDDSGARTLRAFSPRAALMYAFGDAANAYVSVSTSFQTPTTTELINAPPPAGSTTAPGGFNQRLSPERALSWEAGVKGRIGERLRYDVAAYTMRVRDEIVPFRVAQVPDRDFFRNAGRARHRGIEVGLDAALTPHVDAGAAYTYSDFVFLDDGLPDEAYEGNRIPGVPPHHLAARVAVHGAGLFAELQGEYVDRFFTTDANAASAVNGAYAVFDLRLEARRRFGQFELAPFAGIGNLLARRYSASVVVNAAGGRYFEPAPGRHVYLGVGVPVGDWRR